MGRLRADLAGPLNTIARAVRRLPLFWKLLVPFLVLMLAVGAAGTFFVVRGVAIEAQANLDQRLGRALVDVRTVLHDRELALLEAVNFAGNLRGMDEAVRTHDRAAASRLLASVRALKPDLDLLVVMAEDGTELAAASTFPGARGPALAEHLADPRSQGRARSARLLTIGDTDVLSIAAPVCVGSERCDRVGIAIAGFVMATLARDVRDHVLAPDAGLAFAGADGVVVGSSGRVTIPRAAGTGPSRTVTTIDGAEHAVVTAPLVVGGSRLGSFGIAMPTRPAFAGVRRAGVRLATIVLLAMLGVVAIGALLSRSILGQVRPLVAASRAFGEGRLEERVRSMSDDELGEVARALNRMAEQLKASHDTLESRVAQRTEEVRRLLDERTTFFASMSHEFRTPLAVILSEADMVLDPERPVAAPLARDAVRTIRTSAEQLLHLINDILDVAQAEAGRMELSPEPVRIDELVATVEPTLRGLASASDLELRIDLARDLPVVLGDPSRLREVILNVVDNAVKYTPSGGSVSIEATRADAAVTLRVVDTGVGIPADVGDRIFEPFYRVPGRRPVRGQPSTGLGLSLAKRIVEAHNGSIAFESTPGDGTTFTVTLPARTVAAEPKPARRRRQRRTPARARARA